MGHPPGRRGPARPAGRHRHRVRLAAVRRPALLACVDFALTAALDHPDAPSNACELAPDQVPAAIAGLDRLPLPDLPMWVELEESPVRWYSTPGGLVRTHGDGWVWLWVRAQTAADLDSICATMPEARWS